MSQIKNTKKAIELNKFILNNVNSPHERDEARFRLKFLKKRLSKLNKQKYEEK